MIGWVFLTLAIAFEVAAATCMKLSESLTRFWPSVLMAIFYILCFLAMIKSLEYLQIGVVYAIWAGVGTAAVAIIGVWIFDDTMPWIKIIGIMFIIAGVAMVNFGGTHTPEDLARIEAR
ncbi:MAG: multidrug efflux SMR transporter [Phycisphaerales bacterium]|jgi:small multidrug resistance pump|nr:multidrug efflux SMR transporter [Phycisphaerales bacterium]MDP6890510.1 multidrug efflux SMR transporter [Phycisphaerales bacterium]